MATNAPLAQLLLTRHAKILRLARLVVTLRARDRFVLVVLEPFPPDVIVAVAGLAPQARVLAQLVARLALVRFRLQHLARCLMLELVVLAQEVVAEAALKHPPTVVPHAPLALDAHRVHQRAGAGVRLQTLPTVADPRLAVVADRTDHLQPGREHAGMLHHTVARFQHALLLATLRTDRQPLQALAEVAERSRLLFPVCERGNGGNAPVKLVHLGKEYHPGTTSTYLPHFSQSIATLHGCSGS